MYRAPPKFGAFLASEQFHPTRSTDDLGKGNAGLGSSSTSSIVNKDVTIKARQLSAISPSSRLASVSSRVCHKKRAAEAARK